MAVAGTALTLDSASHSTLSFREPVSATSMEKNIHTVLISAGSQGWRKGKRSPGSRVNLHPELVIKLMLVDDGLGGGGHEAFIIYLQLWLLL